MGAFIFAPLELSRYDLFYHGVQIFAVHLRFIIKLYVLVKHIFLLRPDGWFLTRGYIALCIIHDGVSGFSLFEQ